MQPTNAVAAFGTRAILSLVAAMLMASPALADPTVAWSPASIEITMRPGDSVQRVLQLTATETVPSGTMRVTNSLAPYLKVNPTSVANLAKGASLPVTVTLTVPPDMPPATIQGTLHLRGADTMRKVGSTIAMPLPITLTILAGPGFLPGAPQAKAVDSLVDAILPIPPLAPSEISTDTDGRDVDRRSLEVILGPDVTVAQLNAILAATRARIRVMKAGVPLIVLDVPDPGSLAAYQQLVAQFTASGIGQVLPAYAAEIEQLPSNPPFRSNPPDRLDTIDHLLAIRAAPAWNLRAALTTPPTVVIIDYFGDGAPDAARWDMTFDPNDFASGVRLKLGSSFRGDHGYHVLSTIAASFGGDITDAGLVTGLIARSANVRVCDLYNYRSNVTQALTACALPRIFFAAQAGSPVVLNTSIADSNQSVASRIALAKSFIKAVRTDGTEDKFVHATAAGNVCNPVAGCLPAYAPAADPLYAPFANITSRFTAAALQDATTLGDTPLRNVLVVENRTDTYSAGTLAEPGCLSTRSYTGGTVSAIGTNVLGLNGISNVDGNGAAELAVDKSGTSMASPAAAALAAALWSVRGGPSNSLDIVNSVLAAARATDGCNPAPAPILDAYATLLTADRGLTPATAPARLALLDIDQNGRFDDADVAAIVAQLKAAQTQTPVAYVNSRYDLNGDGYTGGPGTIWMDLDAAQAGIPGYNAALQVSIDGVTATFNETAVTDAAVLCYYAYSPLFDIGAGTAARDTSFSVNNGTCGLASATLLGATLVFDRRYPTVNTPYLEWAPPTVSTVVTAGPSDTITWRDNDGLVYALVDPESQTISWTLPTASLYLGTGTVFDGFVVTGFPADINSAIVESANGIAATVTVVGTRELNINLNGNYAAGSNFRIGLTFK